jgi:hypothetical protein
MTLPAPVIGLELKSPSGVDIPQTGLTLFTGPLVLRWDVSAQELMPAF